jgi:hypothetical protein
MGAVTQSARYRRRPDLLSRTAPGVVVLARVDGTSVTLTGSGASVWALLDEARTVGDLAADLAAIYHADPSQIADDIEPLLTELVQSGYVDADA